MKRGVLLFIILFAFMFLNVKADEIYYTNPNSVSMTEHQYNFLGEMYFDGFQEYITQAEFNRYLTYGYFDSDIEKVILDDTDTSSILKPINDRGLIHETNAKRLTLAKSCGSSTCLISVTLHWKGQPTVKSYDVIGALLYGSMNLIGEPTTYLNYSGGNLFYGDEKYSGDGFGTSVKLQNSSTLMNIYQSYDVSGTGTLYASYQHATSNITKTTSQKYTISYGGYGGVFHFYGSAVGVFDHMGGVNTTINI